MMARLERGGVEGIEREKRITGRDGKSDKRRKRGFRFRIYS